METYLAQFADLSRALRQRLEHKVATLDRFTAELRFAHGLRRAYRDGAAEWQERITPRASFTRSTTVT